MKTIIKILLFILLICSTGWSQNNVKDTASINIITKVPYNGQYYFIQITPITKENINHMPMTGDRTSLKNNTVFWNDSLNHMFPDSVLQRIKGFSKLKIK